MTKQILIPKFIDFLCKQFAIEVIHCPYQAIPKTKKAKIIITLHDVQELHFPEFFSPQQRASRAIGNMDHLFCADKVIVSFDHVKIDLMKYFQISEEKVDVLLIKMSDLWINNYVGKKTLDVENITGGDTFLLYPANTWKHKNHLNLIQAVSLLRDEFNLEVKVICTGDKEEHFGNINSLINELNLEKQIVFTGIVSEHILYSLYKTCRAVVIPTLYEAGSFPLYESILLNVPVVCSNVTSLPKTINNDDCLFNPFDIENIASKMKEIWVDEKFRSKVKDHLKTVAAEINSNNPLPVLQGIYSSFSLK